MSDCGIIPRGPRVVILPDEVETTTKSGIYTSSGANQAQLELAQIDGIVVAMGDTCYSNYLIPWCKVGDRVMFGKYSGIFRVGKDGKKYRVIDDEMVVAIIEE